MKYENLFPPKVRSFKIQDEDGVEVEFFYRRPKAIEVLDQQDAKIKADKEAEQAKKEGKDVAEPSQQQANREAIQRWIVHDDGSAITDDEVQAVLEMDTSAFALFSEKLVGIMRPKEVEVKNA